MEMSDSIQQFIELTHSSESIAQQYLNRNDNDLLTAVNDFFSNEKPNDTKSTSKTKNSSNYNNSRFGTFSGLRSQENTNNNDDDDDDPEQNFFTGGEKSALQVENPNKDKNKKNPLGLVDDLIKKAEKEANEPDTRESTSSKIPKNSFKGTGYKLGSVENSVESKKFGNEISNNNNKIPEKVTRTITFWKEGFSIDDGSLFRYDDPTNEEYLKQLNMGRAPLSLLKVEMFQDVDVHVIKKLDESYKPTKKAKTSFGFSGKGQRLGSPIPGEPIISETPIAVEASKEVNSSSNNNSNNSGAEGEGDTTVQIRLANGKRLVRKFDSNDPVEVIFDFVNDLTNDNREWSLAFAFPLQVIDDLKHQAIKDAGLKNAVIVQRWK